MRTLRAMRYVTPLREGGSLPAIVEGDDQGLYVLKFRGAGQGPKALIAEIVAGELARAMGLTVPELVRIEVDPELGRNEPDPEIRELLKASVGLNLGVDYLPGSLTYDPLGKDPVPGDVASAVVWFDAFVLNMDRTPKNPNLLTWHRKLYLIDHGASLYFHHDWKTAQARASDPFAGVKQHVLLRRADALPKAAAELAPGLEANLLDAVLKEVPDAWLAPEPGYATSESLRQAYKEWLLRRQDFSQVFLEEAIRARSQLI